MILRTWPKGRSSGAFYGAMHSKHQMWKQAAQHSDPTTLISWAN